MTTTTTELISIVTMIIATTMKTDLHHVTVLPIMVGTATAGIM